MNKEVIRKDFKMKEVEFLYFFNFIFSKYDPIHQLIDEYHSLIKSTSYKKEILNWLESRFLPLCNEILALLKEALALSKKLS